MTLSGSGYAITLIRESFRTTPTAKGSEASRNWGYGDIAIHSCEEERTNENTAEGDQNR